MSFRGSCLCNSVQFEINGNFENFFLCYCKHCRKDIGLVHVANLFSSNAKLNWQSGQELIRKYKLPVSHHTKSFCSECSSALPFEQTEFNLVIVPADSLDDKIDIQPIAHIFMASKAKGDENLGSVNSFDTFPGS